MLRRKLLIILLCVTALLMSLAVAAVVSMRSIHEQLEQVIGHDMALAEHANRLTMAVSEVELQLYAIQAGRQRHLDELVDAGEAMSRHGGKLAAAANVGRMFDLLEHIERFQRHIGALAVIRDPELVHYHSMQGIEATGRLREQILALDRHLHERAESRLGQLTRRFRWLVLGMAIGFLVVINGSVLLLVRSSEMVVQPVDQLVAAARALAAGRFAHRVNVAGRDEFQELGMAFNHLAQQLQDNEQRRVELLGQTALTLNHELNNAIAVIELELTLLSRRRQDPVASERCLRQIHENLRRMAGVVESLKHVRQIVLRDYVGDTKMLDLERSIEAVPAAALGPAKREAKP